MIPGTVGTHWPAVFRFLCSKVGDKLDIESESRMSADLKKTGLDCLRRREYSEAIKALAAHVNETPHDYEAATAIAVSCHKLGRWDEAQGRFEALVQQYPNSASVRYHFGLALEEAGRTEAAKASYQEALRLRPRYKSVIARLEALGVVVAKLPS